MEKERKRLSFYTLSVFLEGERLKILVSVDTSPHDQSIPSYCSPRSEFYLNNRGCLIAGHATGNNASHLFYSSIHNTEVDRASGRRREEGGRLHGAFRRWK